ncbi:hypothetical protein GAYE_SCF01G2050 [Galdieria yellowstonensis]|uniref:HSF-type DNA-binding domain-containing protein n=1 Tax=Galdieria yellowstonensis TaxID=3028027 RepID=A0AAV9IA42_9RHOD|nr:hypothetical protein GAYE_SCF01G2050 [Galdieria yellowstonensis]
MSSSVGEKVGEKDDFLQNTSEVTNSPAETVFNTQSDDLQKYAHLEHAKERENSNHSKAVADTAGNNDNNKKESREDNVTKSEVQQMTGDGYCMSPFVPSDKQPTVLTYPIPCPWPSAYPPHIRNATETELGNLDMPTTNYLCSGYHSNRNGLTAILDAVHERERLSTPHSFGSNVAESSSLGKESSESYTRPVDYSLQQTQQSMESTSFRRSAHSSSKGPEDRIATPFLRKLYRLVSDPKTQDLCSWTASGRSFVIWNPTAFARDVLPNYFKHNNLSSFVRQLNQYGFHKMHPDAWEFGHPRFIRGREDLVATIERRPSRPGKGRWNDRDDDQNNSPVQKRPKAAESLDMTNNLEESQSKTAVDTNRESIHAETNLPPPASRSRNIGGTIVSSSNKSSPSAATFWQSYQPFVFNDDKQSALKNGIESNSTNSSSPPFRYPQYGSSVSSSGGTMPWIASTGMPATDFERRLYMIEQAISQLYYTVHELCRDRDFLRHDIQSMRKRIGETATEEDGKVPKEKCSTEQV